MSLNIYMSECGHRSHYIDWAFDKNAAFQEIDYSINGTCHIVPASPQKSNNLNELLKFRQVKFSEAFFLFCQSFLFEF